MFGQPYQHSSVIPSTGQVVVFGSKTSLAGQDYAFYFFDSNGKPTGRELSNLCGHPPNLCSLLCLFVYGREHLVVSCYECRNICTINLQTSEITTSFRDIGVHRIWLGRLNTLYTVDRESMISVFDTSKPTFSCKYTLQKFDKFVNDMHYIANSDLLVLISLYNKTLCTVKSSDGHMVWDKSIEQIHRKTWPTSGCVYFPTADMLLLGDYNRIIAVACKTGDVVQEFAFELGFCYDLHLKDELLTVRHLNTGDAYEKVETHRIKLSSFLVSYVICLPLHSHNFITRFLSEL